MSGRGIERVPFFFLLSFLDRRRPAVHVRFSLADLSDGEHRDDLLRLPDGVGGGREVHGRLPPAGAQVGGNYSERRHKARRRRD